MPPLPPNAVGSKRQRAARACDRCHRLGRKCRPSDVLQICQTCLDYGELCTYVRPQGKRGAPPRRRPMVGSSSLEESNDADLKHLPSFLTLDLVLELLEVYKTTVYPIYCVFHWKSFEADICRRRHEHDLSFQTTVLAVCAIAAARLRDGALTETTHPTLQLSDTNMRSIEHAVTKERATVNRAGFPISFDDARTAYLLAILGLQNGDYELLQTMMGRYLALSALLQLHDESSWPVDLTAMQIQERRVLFWSAYTTDVFIAMIWGGMIRHRDSKCLVSYPDRTLVDEEEPPNGDGNPSWIDGWNVITDLYRIASLVMEDIDRQKSPRISPRATDLSHILHTPSRTETEAVWPRVNAAYQALSPAFQMVPELVGDFSQDVYGFQAANLKVTIQSIKMLLACSGEISMNRRCEIAGELLDALAEIPTVYMKMISVPFLHQLATIGGLLGSVVQGPLTISTYIHVRQILLSFSNFVSNLEDSLRSSARISEKLVRHVERIDAFMSEHGLPGKPTLDLFRQSPLTSTQSLAGPTSGYEIGSATKNQTQGQSDLLANHPESQVNLPAAILSLPDRQRLMADPVNHNFSVSGQEPSKSSFIEPSTLSTEMLEAFSPDENPVVELPDAFAESWSFDWSTLFAWDGNISDPSSTQGTGFQSSSYTSW